MDKHREIKLLILVATDEEKDLLLADEVKANSKVKIIVTGVGQKNVINSIREYCWDAVTILNIGLSAGTSNVPKDTIIPVTAVMPGFNYGNHQVPISLPLCQTENAFPCVSAPGFITDIHQFFPESCYSHDYVVDMELYTIASFFKKVYGIKVVSDDGNFDDYLSSLENYEAFTDLRFQILDIINNLLK